ncbi:MAG: MoaD/ThiS family protein [Planctomycetes bacterium]|nr:MoaD/ThiS family protein [Planctomycetota bacterium]
MRIELFGIARARAGRETIDVEAGSLGEAIRALARACPGVVPEVVEDGRLTDSYLASLNGDRFVKDPELRLAKGDTLLILGAQAGG